VPATFQGSGGAGCDVTAGTRECAPPPSHLVHGSHATSCIPAACISRFQAGTATPLGRLHLVDGRRWGGVRTGLLVWVGGVRWSGGLAFMCPLSARPALPAAHLSAHRDAVFGSYPRLVHQLHFNCRSCCVGHCMAFTTAPPLPTQHTHPRTQALLKLARHQPLHLITSAAGGPCQRGFSGLPLHQFMLLRVT